MAFLSATPSNLAVTLNPHFRPHTPSSTIAYPKISLRLGLYRAVNKQGGPVRKPRASNNNKKKKVRGGGGERHGSSGLILDDVKIEDDDDWFKTNERDRGVSQSYRPHALPTPPAGFVVDEEGKVLMVSNKQTVTVVDSNNLPLECIIRRVFRNSRGDECMLLCPLDMPVLIMKSKNINGWSTVNAEEVEGLLPTVAYALAKVHMHLVHSGFCYTARGGFCFTEDAIFEHHSDDGQDADGLSSEGIEITCFNLDGSHYMIYTPTDPLLFVGVKDQNGDLQIVKTQDLWQDPDVASAIDEETEFNALVEEEAALLDSLLGKG